MKNIGFLDKILRGLAGLFFIYLGSNFNGINILSVVLFIFGIFLILTSMFEFCPIYLIFNIKTKKTEDK